MSVTLRARNLGHSFPVEHVQLMAHWKVWPHTAQSSWPTPAFLSRETDTASSWLQKRHVNFLGRASCCEVEMNVSSNWTKEKGSVKVSAMRQGVSLPLARGAALPFSGLAAGASSSSASPWRRCRVDWARRGVCERIKLSGERQANVAAAADAWCYAWLTLCSIEGVLDQGPWKFSTCSWILAGYRD